MKKKLILAGLMGILAGLFLGYLIKGYVYKDLVREQHALMEEIQGINRELIGKVQERDSMIEWLFNNYKPEKKGEKRWEQKKEIIQ